MRRVKYHVATTADGFIARHDGSFDFFPTTGDHIPDYFESLKSYDAALMGRKTYEAGFQYGVTDPYPHLKSFVFSRSTKESPNPKVQLIAEDAATFVAKLKSTTGGDIYLCGGADLASQLFKAGLINEVLLKINPVLLGAGLPLFNDIGRHIDLRLMAQKIYESGVVLLTYVVKQ